MNVEPEEGEAVPATLIESCEALERFVRDIEGAPHLALDTEANSLHAYREQTCVVQLSADGRHAIVDALAVEDLSALALLTDSTDRELIFHGGDYDISILSRDHGFRFHRVFDTMIAAMLLGEERLGLAHLVEDAYGVVLDKRFQRADWGKRPLTAEQLTYLYRDTAYLEGLRDQLRTRLEEADLVEEAEIEFARLAGRVGRPVEFDADGWRRMKGARSLDATGRAVLAALHLWREGEAERRNRPPFKVLSPRALVAIAAQPPRDARRPDDLKALHPGERRRYGDAVLEAARHGIEDADAGRVPPRSLTPRPTREETQARKRAKQVEDAIRTWRRRHAEERKVVPLVVLPNPAMVWILENEPRTVEDLAACPDIGPKRTARYGDELIEVVDEILER